MPIEQRSAAILLGMHSLGVTFLVVGDIAGLLQGIPSASADLEVVFEREPENAARLLGWLLAHDAHDPRALPYQKLKPTENTLLSDESVFLQTDLGKLRLRMGISDRYEAMLPDTIFVNPNKVEATIAMAAHFVSNGDRGSLPVMLADGWPDRLAANLQGAKMGD